MRFEFLQQALLLWCLGIFDVVLLVVLRSVGGHLVVLGGVVVRHLSGYVKSRCDCWRC